MQIQGRLLLEAKLKYAKAVKIAVAMETAIHNAAQLQNKLNPVCHIDKLITKNNKASGKLGATSQCYHCGSYAHLALIVHVIM